MRHLFRHSVLIIAITLIAFASIWPPSKTIKLAKDLQGGTSLVYQVNLGPSDPVDTMERVRELLKRRLDPDGLMDIGIEVQSGNRVEITMPLPGADVARAREAFEAKLKQLVSGSMSATQLNAVFASADRAGEIKALAGGDAAREAKLNEAAAIYDGSVKSRQEVAVKLPELQGAAELATKMIDEAKKNSAPAEEIDRLTKAQNEAVQAILNATDAPSQAMAEFEAARDAVLRSSVSEVEIRRALALSRDGRNYMDDAGVKQRLDSPRERAINRLKDKYKGAGASIDAVVKSWDEFRSSRKTLDDVEDLKRLMRASGSLTFRIAPKINEAADEGRLRQELRERGPRNVRSTDFRWYKLNKIDSWVKTNEEFAAVSQNAAAYFIPRGYVVEEFDGEYFMLCYDTPWRGNEKKRLTAAEGAWKLASAGPTQDEFGKPSIAFNMDTLGGDKMGQLTGANVGQAMAVLLDDEIYTAPNIQSRIGGSGRITGSFSMSEINYVVRVLNAGSLAAKVSPEPVSDNTIAPELGADNLSNGLRAGVIAFVVVSGFMIVYYFAGGLFAVFGLFLHGVIILAAMSLYNAAFSLPGIAGVVLVFGMAVDANVLVYERMREEMEDNGHDLRTAVRLGFQRALTPIVDGNVTNLIVCVVLMFFGTQEIRGFAITMLIGAVTTLFCQLYVTRVLFAIFVDKLKWRKMSMLPIAVPAIHRVLSPNIDWMKNRWYFASFSIILSILCIGSIAYRGTDVLDNAFLGGSKVTVTFRKGETPINMKRGDVEERLKDYAKKRQRELPEKERALLQITDNAQRALKAKEVESDKLIAQLAGAQIITVNPLRDGVTSSTFVVKTVVDDAKLVQDVVAEVFQEYLPTLPKLSFPGDDIVLEGPNDPRARQVVARPITTGRLSEVLDLPGFSGAAPDYLGGVAMGPFRFEPLTGEQKYPSLASLNERLDQMKKRPQFTASVPRKHQWLVVDGTPAAVQSAVLVVRDDQVSYLADEAQWLTELRVPEWNLAVMSLTVSAKGASVESFTPAIARQFAISAVWSVLLSSFLVVVYLFVRFNSFRYSAAAIATTLHDCLVAVGFIAVAGVICDVAPGFAAALGLLPFKIDLNVIAAVLTILGYSLNDTIVVMDRIREKRGKVPYASRIVINKSINETISRTVITAGTVFLATIVLYIFGGEAIRSFSFCLLVGVITGTYSSIAVAAPIVWVRSVDPTAGGPDTAPVSGEIVPATA